MPHRATPDDSTPVTAAQVAQNGVFEKFARAGFVVSGLLHLIIGYLAIRIALGAGGTADQSGALATLAARPGGPAALWLATAALLMLGLWRLVETFLGRSVDRDASRPAPGFTDRAKSFGIAAVYLGFAYSAFGFAHGAGKSTGQQSSAMSARLMETTAGTVALVGCGVGVVAVGAYHVYKGAGRKFVDDLNGKPGKLVRRLGVAGYVGKGVVLAAAGLLVVVAAWRSEPAKATGLDGALKTLGAQPFGMALLIAAGVGIITYGLYSFVLARSTKM
ncbi:membrane protein [Mycobacterium kiyosense]|uniref:Membrane protein n=1 Tax=Mycobacterium kiyosense TaxID=2871094 RepID=A0A9P3Q6X5_9MYCO|nr:membrane protein [Mycobacterium kiyosense]BDE13703.1 membrane protein [Mycobacterium sp. 20KCMC460]GLB84470.1 membrane protein [Mycobacterium kiyosense]GLB89053.1 membrane protein [Mycobacterium kiyosense]GLB94343.1 membrane protein [Mycobacterium kiyosense]